MFITVIAGDQHDPTIQTESCCDCHYVYGENTFIKGHLYFVTELQSKPRSRTWLWVGGSYDSSSGPHPHPGSHQAITQSTAVTNSMRCFSTTPVSSPCCWHEDHGSMWKREVFVSFLGMKTYVLVTGTQISSCHHPQSAVLALQMGLLKILLLWLWPLKDICICLLPYLLSLRFWSALVHPLALPVGKN